MLPRNPTRRGATRVLAVVSRATGALRRLIDADEDREYRWHENSMHIGERAVYVTHDEYDALETIQDLHDFVAQRVGFTAAPDSAAHRYAHVDDTGTVVGVCIADPTCGDTGEHFGVGHRIVQHADAQVGWREVAGKLSSS